MAQPNTIATNGFFGAWRRFPAALAVVAHVVLFLASGTTAFLLRFDLGIPKFFVPYLRGGLCVWVIVKTFTFLSLRLHRALWRYVSSYDLAKLLVGNILGSACSAG